MKRTIQRWTNQLGSRRHALPMPVTASAVAPPSPVAPPDVLGADPHWARYRFDRSSELPAYIESTVGLEVGDIAFLDNGAVALGGHVFAGGCEIVNHHWGNFVANRGAGASRLLAIDRPDGETYYYCFQHQIWYRYVPATGHRNILVQTLSEQWRQHRAMVLVFWLRQLIWGVFALAFVLFVAFAVFGVVFWTRK